MNFKARCVALENDGETQTVGFADSEFGPETYVILQRAIEPDEQDIRLGLDQLYMTINDQSRSTYGGILEISISPGLVVIRLSAEAVKELRADGDIIVDIEVAEPSMREIKENLEVLANGRCPVIAVDGLE